MKSDELVQTLRTSLIRDITDSLEVSLPYLRNDALSKKLYEFMITNLSVDMDENELVTVVEDAFTFYDNDLSDYLMLADYQVNCGIIDEGLHPTLEVTVSYKSRQMTRVRMNIPTARLMFAKRKRELA